VYDFKGKLIKRLKIEVKQNIEKKINSLIITNTVFLQLHHNTFKSIHYRNKKKLK